MKTIYLLRHAQSLANVSRKIFATVPDYAITLTENGEAQAKAASFHLFSEISGNQNNGRVGVYFSPYERTLRTKQVATRLLNIQFNKEDVRLRERERSGGFFNDLLERSGEKEAYGEFFYRFKGGESCADVFDRVSSFKRDLLDDLNKSGAPDNFTLVMHGESMRILLMALIGAGYKEYETWPNPWNCSAYKLLYLNGEFIVANGANNFLDFSR